MTNDEIRSKLDPTDIDALGRAFHARQDRDISCCTCETCHFARALATERKERRDAEARAKDFRVERDGYRASTDRLNRTVNQYIKERFMLLDDRDRVRAAYARVLADAQKLLVIARRAHDDCDADCIHDKRVIAECAYLDEPQLTGGSEAPQSRGIPRDPPDWYRKTVPIDPSVASRDSTSPALDPAIIGTGALGPAPKRDAILQLRNECEKAADFIYYFTPPSLERSDFIAHLRKIAAGK